MFGLCSAEVAVSAEWGITVVRGKRKQLKVQLKALEQGMAGYMEDLDYGY